MSYSSNALQAVQLLTLLSYFFENIVYEFSMQVKIVINQVGRFLPNF